MSDGKFKPGQSGNPEGKPKGAKNKVGEKVRAMVAGLIEENFEDVTNEFKELKGRDKVKAFIDLLPYVVPKLQNTELKINPDELTDEQLDGLYLKIMEGISNDKE